MEHSVKLSHVRLFVTPRTARSTPGLPVHHQLSESTQTHVHRVSDAIQPSYPLSSPSPPALNLSQHQGLFQWVSSSHQVAKVLEFQLQHLSFQWIFKTDILWDGLVGSPCSPRDSQESSPTPQFKSINSLPLSFREMQMKTTINYHLIAAEGASLVTQTVWNLLAMCETQVQSLGRKESCRKEWLPTTVFLPGEIHGQRSLVGYSPWDRRVRHHWATNTIIAAEQLYQKDKKFKKKKTEKFGKDVEKREHCC